MSAGQARLGSAIKEFVIVSDPDVESRRHLQWTFVIVPPLHIFSRFPVRVLVLSH